MGNWASFSLVDDVSEGIGNVLEVENMLKASSEVQHCIGETFEPSCHCLEICGAEPFNFVMSLEVDEAFEIPELDTGIMLECC